MSSQIQSILAIAIVLVTTGIVIYSSFIKRKSGCGGGCGCAGQIKKFPSSKKK